MRFTDLFIKRPVLAIVVNLVILIAGLQSIRSLSVRQYPRSDIAVVNVSTAYVGANADLVRGFVTTPPCSLTTSCRNSSGVRRSVLATRLTDTIDPFVCPSADR